MEPEYKFQLLRVFWEDCVYDALNALSKMIREDVRAEKSSIDVELINDIPKLMNPKEITTNLIYTVVENHLKCAIIFCSPLEHLLKLADILLNKKIDFYDAMNEENKSVILELGMIVNGYLASALNNLFSTKFRYKLTGISSNSYRAIENFGFGNMYTDKIDVLMFRNDFSIEREGIEGKLFLLTENKIDIFLGAISKKIVMNY